MFLNFSISFVKYIILSHRFASEPQAMFLLKSFVSFLFDVNGSMLEEGVLLVFRI